MGTVHPNQLGPCVLFEKAVALLIAELETDGTQLVSPQMVRPSDPKERCS